MTDGSRGSSRRAEKSAHQAETSAPAYRIEDLAHLSGATVRTIRAYQDSGLLPPPRAPRLRQRPRAPGGRRVACGGGAAVRDLWPPAGVEVPGRAHRRPFPGVHDRACLRPVPGGPAPSDGRGRCRSGLSRRRLRPLAQQTVDAELGSSTPSLAVQHLLEHLGTGDVPTSPARTRDVVIPVETMRAVERLVGAENAAEFIAPSAERELRARSLDRLAASHGAAEDLGETPGGARWLSTESPTPLWITGLGCGSNIRSKIIRVIHVSRGTLARWMKDAP